MMLMTKQAPKAEKKCWSGAFGEPDGADDGQDGMDLLFEALAAADDRLRKDLAVAYRNPASAFGRFRRMAHQLGKAAIPLLLDDPGFFGILHPGVLLHVDDPAGPIRREYRDGNGTFQWTPQDQIFEPSRVLERALVAWFSARAAVWGDTFEY